MEKNINLKAISFSITSYCLCKCKHCLVDAGIDKKVFLDKNIVKNVCEQLKTQEILPVSNPIAITGGEASLHPDLIEIVEIIRSVGYKKVNISMTGIGLTEEKVKLLAPMIHIASFSIDGDKEYHNNFRGIDIYDQTIERINMFQTYGVTNTAIQMSVSKDNFDRIDDLILKAVELGVNHVRLVPILPIGRAVLNRNDIHILEDEDYEKLLLKVMQLNGKFSNMDISSILDRKHFLEKHPEKVYGIESVDNIEINQEGNVYFCSMIDDDFCIGNINKDTLSDIMDRFLESHQFLQYNELSQSIYQDKVKDGNNNTICIMKERQSKLQQKKDQTMLRVNKNYHISSDSENHLILDKDENIIGKINDNTFELLNYLASGMSLESICNKIVREKNYTYKYVKNNMIKVIQYLLANDILVEYDNFRM